ncbi:uncharacterized protein RJT20DRAFT_146171 [Scheffersomyces xylosifermentans]|uniref:uncharacterized protein n=1 Tax=Scheffersomyces xylosifermentans TaxID=1304137 RepID=UPI00315C817F
MEQFDSQLKSHPLHASIKFISSARQLSSLLDYYYRRRHAEQCKAQKLFPYLHGLDNINQRAFFLEGNEENTDDISHVISDNSMVNLMFLNSSSGNHKHPNLINTIDLKDLLEPKTFQRRLGVHFPSSSSEVNEIEDVSLHREDVAHTVEEYKEYLPFNHVWQIDVLKNQRSLNNRNYKSQIKLMAPLSSFVVYNFNDEDNEPLALMIASLKNERKRQTVYIVENSIDWNSIDSDYFDNSQEESLIYQNNLIPESNLIWRLNSMKWIYHNKICLGNITDFNKLSTATQQPFKLIINCHESASLPSSQTLHSIIYDISKGEAQNSSVYYLEFPSSGCFSAGNITAPEIITFLNVLKLIHLIVNKLDQKAFIFSFDGFTGLSLLTISLTQLLGACNIEDAVIQLLANTGESVDKSVKLYFFKSDIIFLKQFERFIDYLKQNLLADDKLIEDLDFDEVNSYHLFHPMQSTSKHDWFNPGYDNNFPSKIFHNLYLGSLGHANSITVLNSIKTTHLISIGECPSWFKYYRNQVIFDYEVKEKCKRGVEILKPIFEFNDGECKIYEVDFTKLGGKSRKNDNPKIPKYLKSLVFVHNLKDDGKDSIMPLLTQCPASIQSKLLLAENPDTTDGSTTLIHCRIGVSRSASIVLASMMKKFHLSLLTCYMYLRVQRFNIIIQPNLKIFYELHLFEQFLGLQARRKANRGFYNWEVLCNEISKLNNHYIE